ncbi:hypothetical protein GCM10027289_06270 [Tsukamurella serpentis]
MTGAVAVAAMAATMAMVSPTGSGSAAAAAPGPKPEAVTATALPRNQVKVEAWNLYQLPDVLNILAGDRAGPEARAAAALERLKSSDADILTLSEVNGSNGKKILEELREKYPYQTVRLADSCVGVYGACSDAPWSVNGGVAIVSKYPIVDTQQYVYRNYSSLAPDAFANKGAVLARIDKDGEQFWVVSTHTQADDTIDDAAARTHELRRRQAQELRAFVETFVAPGAPVIYGGDFNVEYFRGQDKRDAQGRSEFEQIKALSGINLFDPGKLPFTFDSAFNPLVRPIGYRDTLDYVGTSGAAQMGGVRVPGLGADPASDHNPVTGTAVLTGFDGSIVRTGADPNRLNATPLERVTYFVYDAVTTTYRMVVMAVEKAVAKVGSLFDRGVGPHPVAADSAGAALASAVLRSAAGDVDRNGSVPEPAGRARTARSVADRPEAESVTAVGGSRADSAADSATESVTATGSEATSATSSEVRATPAPKETAQPAQPARTTPDRTAAPASEAASEASTGAVTETVKETAKQAAPPVASVEETAATASKGRSEGASQSAGTADGPVTTDAAE